MAFIPYYSKENDTLRTPLPKEYDMDQCAVFSVKTSDGTLVSDNAWWQMLVTMVTEEHIENYDLHETLANTIVTYALGPKPIRMAISGYILSGGKADDKLGSFFQQYLDAFRAKRLSSEDRILQFKYKETTCSYIIETIGLAQAAGQDEYTEVFIDGYAFHYKTNAGIQATAYTDKQLSVQNGSSTAQLSVSIETK